MSSRQRSSPRASQTCLESLSWAGGEGGRSGGPDARPSGSALPNYVPSQLQPDLFQRYRCRSRPGTWETLEPRLASCQTTRSRPRAPAPHMKRCRMKHDRTAWASSWGQKPAGEEKKGSGLVRTGAQPTGTSPEGSAVSGFWFLQMFADQYQTYTSIRKPFGGHKRRPSLRSHLRGP